MKEVFSAGGVVYKYEEGTLKILSIITKKGKVWSFPKGIIEKNESPEEAAIREIKEETGVDGEIIDEVGEVSYWFIHENEKYFKRVKYFLVRYTGGDINPNDEVETAQWLSPSLSLEILTYENDKEILKKALEKING